MLGATFYLCFFFYGNLFFGDIIAGQWHHIERSGSHLGSECAHSTTSQNHGGEPKETEDTGRTWDSCKWICPSQETHQQDFIVVVRLGAVNSTRTVPLLVDVCLDDACLEKLVCVGLAESRRHENSDPDGTWFIKVGRIATENMANASPKPAVQKYKYRPSSSACFAVSPPDTFH